MGRGREGGDGWDNGSRAHPAAVVVSSPSRDARATTFPTSSWPRRQPPRKKPSHALERNSKGAPDGGSSASTSSSSPAARSASRSSWRSASRTVPPTPRTWRCNSDLRARQGHGFTEAHRRGAATSWKQSTLHIAKPLSVSVTHIYQGRVALYSHMQNFTLTCRAVELESAHFFLNTVCSSDGCLCVFVLLCCGQSSAARALDDASPSMESTSRA